MSYNITVKDFTREELVKAIAEFVRNAEYNDRGEIADALIDGSWIQYYNGNRGWDEIKNRVCYK